MASNDDVIRVITMLFGDEGISSDLKEIKDGLQVQNGYIRATQIDVAKLQVQEGITTQNAKDALEIAQSLRVDAAKQGGKQGGIWGTIVSAVLIGATEALRWLGSR